MIDNKLIAEMKRRKAAAKAAQNAELREVAAIFGQRNQKPKKQEGKKK